MKKPPKAKPRGKEGAMGPPPLKNPVEGQPGTFQAKATVVLDVEVPMKGRVSQRLYNEIMGAAHEAIKEPAEKCLADLRADLQKRMAGDPGPVKRGRRQTSKEVH